MTWLGCERIELDVCDSTNDEALALARRGARHGTIVVAHAQRAGRGRDGRSWSSPPGMGLYFSAVLRPDLALAKVPPLTLAIGIAVVDAARACGAPAQLKWPNDVLVHGRKLAGVLVEAHSQGGKLDAVIAGIGVNLTGELPDEVARLAITIDEASTVATAHAGFEAALVTQLETWIDRYVAGGISTILGAWTDRMAPGLSARASVDGAIVTGDMVGLADDGALLLRTADDRVHRVRSGDVEMIKR